MSLDLAQRIKVWLAASVIALALAGCATPAAPTAEAIAQQQRADRAQASVAAGQKLYEEGSYKDALMSFAEALDSGVLTLSQQLVARKHMAFIYCVTNRALLCKDEFQKAFSLSEQFDLSPAEVGHPIWGPVFRAVKSDIELRRVGSRPQGLDVVPAGSSDKAFADGMIAYNAANYAKAITLFDKANMDATVLEKKINTHKFIAFSYCLTKRVTLCRAEFGKILLLDPNFELGPAEAGHPSWGPSFQAEKAKRKPAAARK